MKSILKVSFLSMVALAFVVTASLTISAQHLISSKAGFVNRTDGRAYIVRRDSQGNEKGRASLGTQMRDGDTLITEAGSYAEILLNPGSYTRLNENTRIRALSTKLNEVRFELIDGSVNVEVGEVEKKLPIEIVTPQGSLFITKDGLHRIDVRGSAVSVAVRQGDLYYGSRELAVAGKAFKIGRGKMAQLNGTPQPLLTKLNKDAVDNFDVWCFNRAEILMSANMNALRQSRRLGTLSYGWIYDPFYSCYTFIPRRGSFWSPYGFGFYSSYGDCYSCYYWPYGYGYGYGRSGGGSSGNSNTGNVPARVVTGLDRAPVRREIEGRRIEPSSGFGNEGRGVFDTGGSGRVVSQPATSAPASAPATSSSPTRVEGRTGGRELPSRP